MTNIAEKPAYVSREEKNGLTREYIQALFDYRDGFLYWKIRKALNTKIGSKAGRFNKFLNRNYLRIDKEDYLNARIVFFYHNGYFPKEVDHINHIYNDDRIENLRAATRSENNRNSSSRKNSSSQYLGVQYVKRVKPESKRWIVLICVNGKNTNVGSFFTEEEAALAYNKMAVKHFGEFANLNIIKP